MFFRTLGLRSIVADPIVVPGRTGLRPSHVTQFLRSDHLTFRKGFAHCILGRTFRSPWAAYGLVVLDFSFWYLTPQDAWGFSFTTLGCKKTLLKKKKKIMTHYSETLSDVKYPIEHDPFTIILESTPTVPPPNRSRFKSIVLVLTVTFAMISNVSHLILLAERTFFFRTNHYSLQIIQQFQ